MARFLFKLLYCRLRFEAVSTNCQLDAPCLYVADKIVIRRLLVANVHLQILSTACCLLMAPTLNKISLTSPVFWYTKVQGLSWTSLLACNPLVMSIINLCGCVFFYSESLSLPFGVYGVVSLFSVEPVRTGKILLPFCPKQLQGAGGKRSAYCIHFYLCLYGMLFFVAEWRMNGGIAHCATAE